MQFQLHQRLSQRTLMTNPYICYVATHKSYEGKNTFYFATFTCYSWMHLVDQANAYSCFYKWFEHLNQNEAKTLGYVIMPNHFHGIFYVPDNCDKTINQLLANGKRFIAYDIIKGLEREKREDILQELFHSTTDKEKKSGKKHRVFKTSSDIKELHSAAMILTKLDYIHRNPCQGKWSLVDDFTTYKHSSAAFYQCERENNYVTDYRQYF